MSTSELGGMAFVFLISMDRESHKFLLLGYGATYIMKITELTKSNPPQDQEAVAEKEHVLKCSLNTSLFENYFIPESENTD